MTCRKIFEKLHLIGKFKFAFVTPWQLLYIFTCYTIFGSFTIFNPTFFENLKTILLLNFLIQNKKTSFERKNNPLK